MSAKRLYRVTVTYWDGRVWRRDYQSLYAARERRVRLMSHAEMTGAVVTIVRSDPVHLAERRRTMSPSTSRPQDAFRRPPPETWWCALCPWHGVDPEAHYTAEHMADHYDTGWEPRQRAVEDVGEL